MAARLYVIPGSHPSMTGRLMLEHKGIDYRRIDLIPAMHKPILRALRFPAATVPALRIDGRRVQGTTAISRALDELQPEPALFPPEAAARATVEVAERWAEENLQPVPRRLSWWAIRRRPADGRGFLEGARLGLPLSLAGVFTRPVAMISTRLNGAGDEAAQADLAALSHLLDHVDRLVADGVIGGEAPNAADFQIATSLRLLALFEDLRPFVTGRPGYRLAERLVPEFPGAIRPIFPDVWLDPLRAT